MNIAITGYTGFLGRALLQEIVKTKLEPVLIGRSNPTQGSHNFVNFSVRSDPSKIALKGIDVLIHCAGLAHQKKGKKSNQCDDQKYWEANVLYTEKIMQVAVNCNIKKVIFVSTIKVSCSNSCDDVIDKATENFTDDDIYAKTKFQAENVIKDYAERNSIEYVIFRPCVMYGDGHKGNLKRFENIFSANKIVALPLNKCLNKRSFLSVTDFSKLLINACVTKTVSGVYLVSDDTAFSTFELAMIFANKYNCKLISFSLPNYLERFLLLNGRFESIWRNVNAKLVVDNTKTKLHFEWEPQQSVSSYIQELKIAN